MGVIGNWVGFWGTRAGVCVWGGGVGGERVMGLDGEDT